MKILLVLISIFIQFLYANTYKIGFSQDTLSNDWRLSQVNEVKEEIKKHSFLTLDIKDANGKIANQISDIEYFINNEYDFIITSPINASITSMVLNKAIKKGIKVILIDRGIITKDYTTFIYPNNQLIAKKAAKFMIKELNKKGTILMLEGVKGSTPTIHRREGFLEITKKYPDIKIIRRTANFLRADAMKVMEEVFSKNIKFDAIYSHSDSMLSGVRAVLEKYKKDKKFLMVGIDYIKEAQTAILNGTQTASFTYPTCGKEGVQSIVDLINKKIVKKEMIIESQMITNKNVNHVEPIF